MIDLKRQMVSEVQRSDANRDLISRLPDCLLHHVLSFLPTKDVVSTGLLSRRWKSLWTGVPDLDFDDFLLYSSRVSLWCPIEASCFMNFVERVLLLRDGSDIRKFRLSCRVCFSASRVHSWISSVIHKVQELDICLFVDDSFLLPLSMFDCKLLTTLKIEMNCTLHLPSYISLPSLKILRLGLFTFPDDKSIQNLFSCCPVLEELAILDCEWFLLNMITISIPLLTSLVIDDLPIFGPVGDDLKGCDINIESPALRFFSYSGYLTSKINLLNYSSSLKVCLHTPTVYLTRKEKARVIELLRTLENANSLRISNCTLQLLFMEDDALDYLPVFRCLEHLELSMLLEDHVVKGLLKFLNCLPKLGTLKFTKGLDPRMSINEDEWMMKSLPNCFMSSIKTLAIWDFRGNFGELCLLKSFLKNSTSLQRINIFPCKASILNLEEQQKWRNEVESLSTISDCVIIFW